MKVFPDTIAIGNIKHGNITGKLNAVMPAPTPMGCIRVKTSTPVAAFSAISPNCKDVIEQACSTTSKPRLISPSASDNVLPCSLVINSANGAMLSLMSCWNFSMMRMRLDSETLRQVLKAFLAEATAISNSCCVAKCTVATTSCVAGLITSRHSEDLDSNGLPSMR